MSGSAGDPPERAESGIALGPGAGPRWAGGDDRARGCADAARPPGTRRLPGVFRPRGVCRCGRRPFRVVVGPVPTARSVPRRSRRSPPAGRPVRSPIPGRSPRPMPLPHRGGLGRSSPGPAPVARPGRSSRVVDRRSGRASATPTRVDRARPPHRGELASSSADPDRRARPVTGAGRVGPGCPRPGPHRGCRPDRCAEFGRDRPPRHLLARPWRTAGLDDQPDAARPNARRAYGAALQRSQPGLGTRTACLTSRRPPAAPASRTSPVSSSRYATALRPECLAA